MKAFFEHIDALFPDRERPWLLLGKGPSFAKYEAEHAQRYYTLALNHVGAQIPVDLTHVIDMEVIEQSGSELLARSKFLVMPWVPHVKHEPTLLTPSRMMDASGITLAEWIDIDPTLRQLAQQNRLLWYNLSSAPERFVRADGGPVVQAVFFSASAAVDLLAKAGRRRVRTLGIDGGKQYSGHFGKWAEANLFANGRTSFDLQFKGITQTIMAHGIEFGPADVETPIRVFVGAEPEQSLAVKLLEYSIKKHSSMSVRVESLHQALADRGMDVPLPQSPALAPRTPFSYQRFAIPALKDYRGRAIYLDSDMLVFDDIKKLWTTPFDGAPLLAVEEPAGSGRRPQYSVALMDCEALKWNVAELVRDLDAGRWTYEQFMFEMAAAPGARAGIASRWNDLERYRPGDTALTHYTDMDQQPWLERVNPIAHVWCGVLLEALEKGFVTRDFVAEEVKNGHVRPSLLAQVDLKIADPLLLPRSARALDRNYLPPHVIASSASRSGERPSLRSIALKRRARMLAWRVMNRLGLWEAVKKLRGRIKAARQNGRIASARRRRGMSAT